jgi:hypothetical protein
MNVKEKYRIVEKIILTNDDSILEEVKDLLGIDEQGDLWSVLPDSVKETIKESLKQSEAGKLLSNEEVMNDIKSRFIKE